MARPERNTVDYFPLFCDEGKKMFYLEETYGNDGFAVFIKLLRELAKSEYHYLDLSNKMQLMFLSAKCKVSVDVLNAIIKDLVELEKFDSVLWCENKVIWCQDFTDSIQDAYKKRNNKCITYDSLIELLISKGVRKPSKVVSKEPVNQQRKEKDTKVDESKAKDNTTAKSYDYAREKEILNNVRHLFDNKFYNTDKKRLNWLDTIRLLHHNDNFSYEKIEAAIKFARADEFWKDTFISIPTLRKKKDDIMKIDKIIAKMPNDKVKSGKIPLYTPR